MIKLNDIQRIFDVGEQKVHALDHLSLTIEQGEYVSIMGPSGSGKSTLLNIIGLLDQATSGQYYLNNRDVTALTELEKAQTRRSEIGFIFQFFHLVPRLTAEENIALPMLLAGIPLSERKMRTHEILAAMGLGSRAKHRPDQLSGGQRQKVAIARATVMSPKVLLADEPTGNLDRHSGEEVIELIERLNQSGISLIVVTHDPTVGERAHRTIRMEDGSIVFDKDARSTHATP